MKTEIPVDTEDLRHNMPNMNISNGGSSSADLFVRWPVGQRSPMLRELKWKEEAAHERKDKMAHSSFDAIPYNSHSIE
jgi:hypothetical protein